MANKLIIQNDTNLSDLQALPYVIGVVGGGRISNDNKQYCYGTRFKNGIMVYTDLNKKSDRFVIRKEQE